MMYMLLQVGTEGNASCYVFWLFYPDFMINAILLQSVC